MNPITQTFPRAPLCKAPTPLEHLPQLSDALGIDLWIKRDDLTSLSFGGNKTRQLEYYLGAAKAQAASVILITGAVQSNFARTAAYAAAMHGMRAVLQRENRVSGMDPPYHANGNVLLSGLVAPSIQSYPEGEDEAGADAALADLAATLKSQGERPYTINLGLGHPPLGALGYIDGAQEALAQERGFDATVVPSGSGSTHSGWLMGLHLAGTPTQTFGICVRRDAVAQSNRIDHVTTALADLLKIPRPFDASAIQTRDSALTPGYGKMSPATKAAIQLMAKKEGILLDPVYSGKTFAGLLNLVQTGEIAQGQKVLMLHTGGTAALFAYQNQLN